MQEAYSESIRYRNHVSGTSTTASLLNIARADEDDVPILQKGALICILPNQEDLKEGDMAPGDNIPFYLGEVQEDEDAPVDSNGRRLEEMSKDDKFQIQWLNNIDTRGKVLDAVTGAWKLRCTHMNNRGAAHPWTENSCCRSPHSRMLATVKRESILLYDVSLTTTGKLDSASKMQICRAIAPHEVSSEIMPGTWRQTQAPTRKRVPSTASAALLTKFRAAWAAPAGMYGSQPMAATMCSAQNVMTFQESSDLALYEIQHNCYKHSKPEQNIRE
eukprot:6201075-Pleurochrysis_carterae.AAC.1